MTGLSFATLGLFLKNSEGRKELGHKNLELRKSSLHPHLFRRQESRHEPMDGPHVLCGFDDRSHQVDRQMTRVVLVLVQHPTQG